MHDARRRKPQWEAGDWTWKLGVSRRFHVSPGLKEIQIVRRGLGLNRTKETRLIRFLEGPPDERAEALAALAAPSLGVEWPAEDEANVMEVGLKVLGHHPVVRANRNLIRAETGLPEVDPACIDVIGPVKHDFRGHEVAEREVLHVAIILGELLIGGAAQGAHVSHHMVAVKTAVVHPRHIDRK